jgi:amino acid adenylation domain-containing protein
LSPRQLMDRLRSLGVHIAASGGRLRVTAERGGLTEQLKQEIAQQKLELLDLLAEEAGRPSNGLRSIPRDGALPLSSFQMRLWVLHRLEPDSTAYNMVTAWLHADETDAATIQGLIRAVLQENEVLRATFRDDGAAPGVYPLPPEAVRIAVRDLRGRSGTDQDAAIQADRMAETRTPFELATETPTRWTLYRVSDMRWVILIAAHHIAVDEWSLTLLRRRIESPHAQSLSAFQYADYAAWQRRTQDPTAIRDELAWWERRLAGIPQLCTFPADRMSNAGESETGSTRPFCWDVELVAGLRRLIRGEGATIYMALLAVCAAVLRAHTGQGDIVLGSPMGTRERTEFETMLGPFVNLLVLRLELDDDPSVIELLARAREVFLDAYDHRQVPFEMLVDRLAPPRSFDRPPLCQIAVVLHNASVENAPLIYGGGSILDLTWYAREIEGRIEGSLEYRADLYDDATIDRIINHLETFLRAAVRDPTCKLSQISLLTAAERQSLLTTFNATTRYIDRASVTVQFERQVAARPDRPAVVFHGNRLSYAALNRRANQLARLLHGRGVNVGALVGVAVERSLDMVVALLGVQKAGAAYVPIDPRFPADRLQFMLADSGIVALIASEETAARFEMPVGVTVIDLAAEAGALDVLEASDLAIKAAPENIAYVIYTSGSTGCPNGVAVSHGALANLLGAMRYRPGLRDTDVVAAVTTISFDIAALELYLPLIVGARIELVSHDDAADGMALARLLSESGATMLQATPTTWRLLIEAGWRAGDGFRAFCGGESMPRDLADILLERVHELWNLYGPTETTIWSTAGPVERGTAVISIGRPIANTTVYILDSAGAPAAIGIPGEIWIGGDGIAAGYHHRPELTAVRFVADPFIGKADARMYRTGDLGRWGADGRLYHMGRLDRQVKFHGFRIELGEIEAALHSHPAVARTVVVAQNLTAEQPRLIAYIVYHPAEDLTVTEARRHIKQILPDYMVPSGFVTLDALPLTPNGKIDVRALPDPFKNAADAGGGYEPPAPGLEQLVAEVWQELLQVDQVGADDNFFELGGNSLLSLRAITEIGTRAGCRLQPRILFFQNLRQVAATARLAEATLASPR